MKKFKFKYNPETLNYDKVDRGFRKKTLILIGYTSILVTAFVIFYAISFYGYLETPNGKNQKRENVQLQKQYVDLKEKTTFIFKELKNLQERDDNIYRAIFNTNPIPSTIRKAGFGGVDRYAKLQEFENSVLVTETAKQLDIILKELYVQSKSYDKIIDLASDKQTKLKHIPAIQPLNNKDLKRTASGYGMRRHPILKIWRMHTGMDFSARTGTPIYATGDGKVIYARKNNHGYGNVVRIDHGYSYKTLYAHMSKILVKSGQRVKRGDVIGLVGNTGLSQGPHVHYEISYKNKTVNPIYYYFDDLTPTEYEKMVKISSNITQSLD